MRRSYQLSLLGGAPGRSLLFDARLLAKYLAEHETTHIPNMQPGMAAIQSWVSSLRGTPATEASLEAKFIGDVLCGVLGYAAFPPNDATSASLYHKPSQRLTRIPRTPDVMLGKFTQTDCLFTAALELKTPGTKLDVPQPAYNNESPVDQTFYYGTRILDVRWVLVTDMRIIRLYSVESPSEFEEINLADCAEPTAFRRLMLLFGHDYLIAGHDQSQVHLLFAKSVGHQFEIRDSFYQAYYEIRADLFGAIRRATKDRRPLPSREELLQATQRLLDRLLFVYYCEDHPQQLIPHETLKTVVAAARRRPGASTCKVYADLKEMFREIDAGSPPGSGLRLAGYNGELFKDHPIIDHIDLPDSLADKPYLVPNGPHTPRRIEGVWGLHAFDFWSELNEHLLGHIFEESLSDLHDLGATSTIPLDEKLRQRKEHGIYFTTSVLSDFLSASALSTLLDERSPVQSDPHDLRANLTRRLQHLLALRVVDLACGSGAFLVSAYRFMLHEFWRLQASLDALSEADGTPRDLFVAQESVTQASLLRDCLAGVDLMPQAVEIAKLALWLRSAKKDERVPDLSRHLLPGNSLEVGDLFTRLETAPASFDLVLGNPPWGGDVPANTMRSAAAFLGLDSDVTWDSWELFLALGLHALRPGGRLALVLPDSFLYPQKARIRRFLFSHAAVEKVHSLGPDWFGKEVRMGTILLQARKGPGTAGTVMSAMTTGELRQRAIRAEVPLTQIETQRCRLLPVSRITATPDYEIQVFRGERDDQIIDALSARSTDLAVLCDRARGEEMSKTGLLWECPSCLAPTTPGTKKKGGGYKPKKCPACGHQLSPSNSSQAFLVKTTGPSAHSVPFIDGDDISRRYVKVQPTKWLRTNVSGVEYKPASVYASPKILLRQAGVGLFATLDRTSARCPQSVYVYRLTPEFQAQGYRHEYILAALLSRTMTYCVFKRFGELDPAKAHAKLTHERLEHLPIPRVDFADPGQQRLHDDLVQRCRRLLNGQSSLGEEDDREIEAGLRTLWGISPDDGAYINGEFYDLPQGQAVRDLFPTGCPRPEHALQSPTA